MPVTNHLPLDEFIHSKRYKEAHSHLSGDADAVLSRLFEALSQRSKAERDVTTRLLGTLVNHLDKSLATRLLTRNDWTDEEFASEFVSDVLLKDTRTDQWELKQQILGAERFRDLVRSHGGALTVAEVARLVEVTPDAVVKQISRRRLIAYKAGSAWYVLRLQFNDDSNVVAGVTEGLQAMAPLCRMDQVRFFLSGIEGSDENPLQRLRRDDSPATIDNVIQMAQRFMVQGGA